jgi:hypothetical protein
MKWKEKKQRVKQTNSKSRGRNFISTYDMRLH